MLSVFLVCSGLGNVKRGFESFTQECFEALSDDPSLDITLFKGGGELQAKEIKLGNLPRDSTISVIMGKLIRRDGYFVEQVSFALSLLPHIYRQQPNVILVSDPNLCSFLFRYRSLTKQSYKLLLSNGGGFSLPFLPGCDYIQQLTPLGFQNAINTGWPASKQSLVPYGIKIPPKLTILSNSEREVLRRQLGLPDKRPLIISVAAINKTHKRMDYLIQETALLSEPRPYLLLLGQKESESPEIEYLGNRLLGTDNFQIRTVAYNQITDYYNVADVFVLASLAEGFGRVILEAMSYGLPCLAHDYEGTRFILGEEGYFANFQLTGSLSTLISKVLAQGYDESKALIRHRSVFDRFSWQQLRPSYVKMLKDCAKQ